jgi:tyrosine decarboxylase/aspartate 1-decarboxylase
MEERGMSRDAVESLLEEKKHKDLSYKRVLSSMCTYPHEIAAYAHNMFLESNLGDSGLFPGTKEMETELIRMIGALLGRENVYGYLSTGGTESNIQAIRAIRNRRKRAGLREMNIIVPETAHFSFDKIADILCVDVKKATLDDALRVDVNSVEELIDANTICVDAAFGGFVIPFLAEKDRYQFDFALDGVSCVSVDPHKMGMSTIPSGCILFRENSYLDELEVSTPYLTTHGQSSLTGTRSGASTAATFAVFKYLGQEGLRAIVTECMRLTRLLVQGAKAKGIRPEIEPVMNVVTLSIDEVDRAAVALKAKGWEVSTTRKPKALRLVIMPHVTEETVKLFLEDLVDVI